MIKPETFMKLAKTVAEESKAVRRKVGALIIKDNNVIAVGYNGTPSGFDNNCETKAKRRITDEERWTLDESSIKPVFVKDGETIPTSVAKIFDANLVEELVTKPEVLHAETNAIAKCAQSVNSSKDADLYTTTSPCFDCSKIIIQAGIKRVFYNEEYKDTSGLELLKKAGIEVKQINI